MDEMGPKFQNPEEHGYPMELIEQNMDTQWSSLNKGKPSNWITKAKVSWI
jgi:hypothetical protein